MSLKPIAPQKPRTKRVKRPAGAPVVLVQKKSSGSGGWLVLLLLLAAAGGGWYVYDNQQKNEAALAAREQRLEENAQKLADVERQKAEHEASKNKKGKTAMGTLAPAAADEASADDEYADMGDGGVNYFGKTAESIEMPVEQSVSASSGETAKRKSTGGRKSAMGSTEMEGGEFAEVDTSAPPFDLTAKGKAAKKVIDQLSKAIDKAGDGNTFHDLQADLKRSFEVAQPSLFADATTLPPFPDKEDRLLRIAQGVYVCLNLAAELDIEDDAQDKKHAKFVNWLMKDKAEAARTFSFGLEHYNITDVPTATKLLGELRATYWKTPSSAKKKIRPILEKAAK